MTTISVKIQYPGSISWCQSWAIPAYFEPRRVAVAPGQHGSVTITSYLAGTLVLHLPRADASFEVYGRDGAALPHSKFSLWGKGRVEARVPVGTYRVVIDGVESIERVAAKR